MGFDEMDSEEYRLKRIRQRKAFKTHWVKIFALSPPDDCLIDVIIDAIEKIYHEEILPLSTTADELILTSSDKKVFELIDGGYRELYHYIKSLVKSVKDGELSEKQLISLLENEIKRMDK